MANPTLPDKLPTPEEVDPVPSEQVRMNFAERVNRAHYTGEVTLIERRGRLLAALIPWETYKQFLRFQQQSEQQESKVA